ncbi:MULTISPECIES: sialate O-acetylesterase [Carboxylicivirga]|uniref:sialate O-acetylesterase n=1 Tax=Carboxylicivirga TaxID=1628153 RepID=UPI001177E4FB|nr:sialate O-acetylesterase [Carboxylicivirga sp. M1479]TRX66093.1 sialate O-acetylesterase [Carboxylicivirga sp. M1479]
MHTRISPFLFHLSALLICHTFAYSKVKPHGLFTNNMVIQQRVMAPVWGSANPGEKVQVSASWGESAHTTTDENGNWILHIKTPEAGGPFQITIKGENTVLLENVMAGDVWVCGGQSNMDFPLIRLKNTQKVPEKQVKAYAQIIKTEQPLIRTILIDKQYRAEPQSDIVVVKSFNNSWQVNASEAINNETTAVGFFFAKELQSKFNIPIGLIDANKGGTGIALWTSDKIIKSGDKKQEIDGVAKGSSVLFNGMIAPLTPFAIKGVIWYQGEANSKDKAKALAYADDLKSMITDWRSHWGQGDFPFLIVQLAGFHKTHTEPILEKEVWPLTRESQMKATELKNIGIATGIDVGFQKDIHPWMKDVVGYRLAKAAEKVAYGEKVIGTGPVYKGMKIKKNKAVIYFDNVGKGLQAKDVVLDGHQLSKTELKGFIIKGEGEFYHAQAVIVGNKVIVSHPKVSKPTAVRYGWADFPLCNLYNRADLPAFPFRTDMDKATP